LSLIVQHYKPYCLSNKSIKMIKQNLALRLIFTISLTLAYAQKPVNLLDINGKRHGLWQKNFEGTDQLRYQGQFFHGKEIDTFKYYTLKQGKSVLSATRVFRRDSDVAKVKFFTSTGGLISEGQMRGKSYVGEWRYYHKNSPTLMITETFNDQGVLHGEKKVFYKNGQLAEESNYKDGNLHGKVSWYSENGQLFKTLTYEKDELEGPAIYYQPGGDVSSKGQYKSNVKRGKWLYYKNGKAYKEIDHTTNKVKKLE